MAVLGEIPSAALVGFPQQGVMSLCKP